MKLFNGGKEYSKNKSIVMLIGYGIFFLFVFIIIATGNSTDTNKSYKDYLNNKKIKTEEKIDNTVDDYEYEYRITDNANIVLITGTKTKEKEIFTLNEISYYKQDNNTYLNDGTNTLVENVFDTSLYSYESINNLVKDRTAKEKTTYEDGTSKEIYNLDSKEYFDYTKEDKCTLVDCTNINIEIIINKNSKEQIEKANINLTNYYKYNYVIELNYTNINNIKEVSTN